MKVKLIYTNIDDEEIEVESSKYIEKIELNKKDIVRIDLTPLSSCNHLREINLGSNLIRDIDLNPLDSSENRSAGY